MVKRTEIQEFCSRLVAEFHPTRVTLFGSYAQGTPRPDSDVDLLVEMPVRGSGLAKAAEMLMRLDPPFAVDLVVRTPQQVKFRIKQNDFFMQNAVKCGRVLYEASHA